MDIEIMPIVEAERIEAETSTVPSKVSADVEITS